jgi:acyl-CoA synthetase (AMP-forming)/AMP-acid ligase II
VAVTAATVWELIVARARATPDALFLVDERDEMLTFDEYRRAAERTAAGLVAGGVEPGSTVAWQLPTWIETAVLLGALARIGARQVPLLPILRDSELEFCLRESATRVLIVPGVWRGYDYSGLAARVAERLGGLSVLECDRTLPDADPSLLGPAPLSGDEARWIYYSSGTTGRPKGVVLTDTNVLRSGAAMAERLRMGAGDRYGIAFPFTHVGGVTNVCAAMSTGFAAILCEAFAPPATTEVYRRHRATVAGGGPAFYLAFLADQRRHAGKPILPDLRFMTGGGASMPPEQHDEVRAEIGGRGCAHGYGMTECCMVAMNDPEDTDEHLAQTVGRPVAGLDVRIVTSDGALAAIGEAGEVRIRGAAVFRGYVNPELDAEAFDEEGWFRTGDLAVRDAEGYLRITGRLKDLIIRKGENISAKELEDLLYECPAIADVAVIGLPDPERGERVCAVVVPADPEAPLTLAEMVRYCEKARIMRQKIPEQLEIADALPRNAAGKVERAALRERLAGMAGTTTSR